MSDRNDNNWNSSSASTESVGNKKTSQNKSLPANKCEDQMQRTDCDIQKDQLISGTTAADTTDSQTTTINDTVDDYQTNGKSLLLITQDTQETQDKASDETSDCSPSDMQKQHTEDQLSQSSNDDSQSTGKRAQSKANKSLGSNNETKSKNDLNANDNSNHKTMSDKRAQVLINRL